MADKKQPLEKCPNYNVCNSYVQAAKRGLPHKYGVYNIAKDKIEYKECSGG